MWTKAVLVLVAVMLVGCRESGHVQEVVVPVASASAEPVEREIRSVDAKRWRDYASDMKEEGGSDK